MAVLQSRSSLVRSALAVALVMAAFVVRLALDPLWGANLPFFTFQLAVMLTAWLAGLWPGVLATALSAALGAYMWLQAAHSFGLTRGGEIIALAFFVGAGLVISVAADLLRRSQAQADRARTEGERLLQERVSLLESTGQAIFGVDLGGRCIFANEACARLLGWPREELLGRSMHEVAHHHRADGSPYPTSECAIARLMRSGGGYLAGDEVAWRRDGTPFPAEYFAHPIVVGGRVTGTVVTLTDLSERRRLEEERSRLLVRERLAVDTAGVGVWEHDGATDRVRLTERARAILGLAEPFTSPAAFLELVVPEDRPRVRSAIRTIYSPGGDQEVECRVRTATGERWLAFRGTALRDEQGRVTSILGTMMDITERKRVEDELRRMFAAEQAAREEAETAATMLRKLQAVTDHALSQLGLEELLRELLRRIRDVLGGDTAGILLLDPVRRALRPVAAEGLEDDAVADVWVPLDRGVAGRIAGSRQGVIVDDLERSQATSAFLARRVRSLIGAPLRADGRLIGVLHVGAAGPRAFGEEDLDLLRRVGDRLALAIERARLLQAERQARQAAEAANRSKDEFLAVLAHELRTPLTAVLGWVRLLRHGRVTGEQARRALESIERNTRLQARLIEDLLDLSRAIAGKLELDRRPVDLAVVVSDAVEPFVAGAADKGVRLTVTTGTQPVLVWGDPLRLAQVVSNLVGNALKFTPAGGDIEVRLDRTEADARLTVRDTGAGIDPAALPHVFDRFHQGAGPPGQRQGGLGLGLAVVRHVVEVHGGRVRAESAGVGCGATFTARIPVLTAEEERRVDARPERPRETAGAGPDLRGLRALLVDDDIDSLELLATVLQQHGAEVTTAADVGGALAALERHACDVLISDVSMPGRNGLDLIRELRRRPGAAYLPSLAVSALTRPEDRDRALAAGFDAFLTKPVEPVVFAGLVATLGGGTPRAPDPAQAAGGEPAGGEPDLVRRYSATL